MALSLSHRRTIFANLAPILGEEEAEALLSELPARIGDEPVTRDVLAATAAELRTDMADLRTELKGDMADLRTEMADLRTELKGDIARLDAAVADRFRQQTVWTMATMVTGFGLVVASNLVA